jgi:4-amino-4-deoxy-L-arabinose transferase-like glycosyltransferase
MSTRRRKTASLRERQKPLRRPATAAPSSTTVNDKWMTFAVGGAVIAATGLLYGATTARDIVLGDTPELIAAAVTLGVPHAPGYPLFTMLGHLFSLFPVDPLPFRVNLLAAVCGALTVGIVYFTALRLTRHWLPSAGAALLLASNPLFWRWSLVAEVFSLNNLLAAAFVFLLVLWRQRPERTKFLVAAALVSGLALTNQHTFVFFGPAVIFLLWQQRVLLLARPRLVAACVAALLIGLLPYAYVPWAAARDPVVNWQGVASVSDFLALVMRKHCGIGQLICMGPYQGGSPVDRILAFGASFGLLVGSLSVLGLIQTYRQEKWYFWFVLLAFMFAGPGFAAYANINLSTGPTLFVLERFFLLSHVIIAPLMAFGLSLVSERLAAFLPKLRAQALVVVTATALLIASGSVLTNYTAIDQSKNHVARRLAEDILSTTKPGTLLLVGGDEIVLPLLYLQAVEGRQLGVKLVLTPLLPGEWYIKQLRRRYPDLVIPFDRHDPRSGTMKSLIDANQGHPIAVVGKPLDESTEGSYWFYRYGVVDLVEPMAKDLTLPQMINDNEELLGRYRPPSPEEIKKKSFEETILSHYTATLLAVGRESEKARFYLEAKKWYERAVSMDPNLSEAREALVRLEKVK